MSIADAFDFCLNFSAHYDDLHLFFVHKIYVTLAFHEGNIHTIS